MPKFYFHVRKGDKLIEDPEGMDFPNLGAARAEAMQAARDIVAENLRFEGTLKGEVFEILGRKRLDGGYPAAGCPIVLDWIGHSPWATSRSATRFNKMCVRR
jgi:hypothetical protein